MNKDSIRSFYEKMGVDNYYENFAQEYKNPHYDDIKELMQIIQKKYYIGNNICDLCCGSGEITNLLKNKNIIGIDPYTYEVYRKNTNNICFNYSFKDIVQGKMINMKFDTIICCFAMHLCEESMLPYLLYQLSRISKKLIIITPHKRPKCDNIYWHLKNVEKYNKITAKIYEKK